jgi:Mg2+/citrate symporter
MRALFSIVGLLMVLVIVGMLVKKQMSNTVAVPAISVPSASGSSPTAQVKPADVPAQVKRELDAAAAQAAKRVETEESK